MRNFILVCFLTLFVSPAWTQSIVPGVTKINHAWVDGVYWNPAQFPGWGFFASVQEENFFGAIYGYQGSNSTFIVLQGTISSEDPLEFRGDVFFVTNAGGTATDVGNFTWSVSTFEASPASRLTISSNILNANNLLLKRFVYVEEDKIDILTGADWNITTRLLGISFGYHYGIYDDRVVQDGIVAALVIDNVDEDAIGATAYYPPGQGDAYGLMIPFLDETDLFAVFLASDTEMFGRFWLLDPGESPSGNGYYFNGSADTIQASNQKLLSGKASLSKLDSIKSATELNEIKNQQRLLYEVSSMEVSPMFPGSTVQNIFENMKTFPLLPNNERPD